MHEMKKCPICRMQFNTDYLLKRRNMLNHQNSQKYHSCPRCPKKFVSNSEFKQHPIHHSGETPIECDICGLYLKSKFNLVQHIKDKHDHERPFECKDCSWTFKRVNDLHRHEEAHSGLK
ncbi:hypothetical protein QAD02_007990 [Eretmocerus hayati]|uniref:Uncharacterized protein n=1 Tax=Eretmocerus hayati TaxID=131215 RepID=A0ACC2N5U3_9HYME|nr:hypothetical protein QAD02_007990 [Eretmocerus hayati]